MRKPYFESSGVACYKGDSLEILRELPDEMVQCVVTSPPYWGLRDYGVAGQLGLEATPDLYISKMVEVFREVKRVLRSDGTLWLNMGDSYAGGGNYRGHSELSDKQRSNGGAQGQVGALPIPCGLKPKDLCGIPWLLAFALRADGWYLRSDIIWHKPNPMPESVTDRPTKAHEYLFLFAKGQSRTRTIALLDVEPEFVHLNRNIGTQRSYVGTTGMCVAIAATLFDLAQEQQDFRLPPFYAQEWQKRTNGSDSDLVAGLPANHRIAAHAARFLNGYAATKEFLGEVNTFWRNLTQADHFLVCGRLSESSLTPGIFVDGDGAITVNDSGKVSKINFTHGTIVVTVPTDCKYYYDAEAIREAWSCDRDDMREKGVRTGLGYLQQGPVASNHAPGANSRIYQDRDPQHSAERKTIKVPGGWDRGEGAHGTIHRGRNKRSVWTVATQPYSEAHFATFPQKLITPCIKAGCEPGQIVLDPFGGSGTTAIVAQRLHCKAILIELNEDYCKMAEKRLSNQEQFAFA